MKFSINDFFSKYDQIRRKLRIWSHLLKKSLAENFIFCAVRLVIGGKAGKETTESSKLEFLLTFSANNFALSEAEGNDAGLLDWEGIADLLLLETLINSPRVTQAKYLGSDRFFCFISISKFGCFKIPFVGLIWYVWWGIHNHFQPGKGKVTVEQILRSEEITKFERAGGRNLSTKIRHLSKVVYNRIHQVYQFHQNMLASICVGR